MDNTVNETWINKLVDELVDAKDEIARQAVDVDQLYTLIKLILNSATLGYSGENLRIENETAIFEYIKTISSDSYYRKLKSLKDERESELKKLAEAKAKEAKSKEEA
jgi:hypothetical protein